MTNRGLAILVAVAVVAGIGVASYGLATKGSGNSSHVLQIDEVNGRVGKVVLGEAGASVEAVLGEPRSSQRSLLGYAHLAVGLDPTGRVVSVRTDDPDAQTEKVVKMGDPISAVRAVYRKAAKCIPNRPDKHDPHPRCTVRVPAGVLFVTGDPIRAMALARRG
jgi:hypothetical protein